MQVCDCYKHVHGPLLQATKRHHHFEEDSTFVPKASMARTRFNKCFAPQLKLPVIFHSVNPYVRFSPQAAQFCVYACVKFIDCQSSKTVSTIKFQHLD